MHDFIMKFVIICVFYLMGGGEGGGWVYLAWPVIVAAVTYIIILTVLSCILTKQWFP